MIVFMSRVPFFFQGRPLLHAMRRHVSNFAAAFDKSPQRVDIDVLHQHTNNKISTMVLPPVVIVVVVVVVVFTLKNLPGLVSIQYLLLSQHQSLYSSCQW